MRRLLFGDLQRARLTAIALIVANLVPLVGMLVLDWSLDLILLLFWAENGVVGFWSLVRMGVRAKWGTLLFGPFFLFHYGGFMAGHLLFLSALFFDGHPLQGDGARLFWVSLAALFASHGLSFWQHFVRGGERHGPSALSEMGYAYLRVVVLHAVIIGGGFLAVALGRPFWALMLLILLKIGIDLLTHAAAHQKKAITATDPEVQPTLQGEQKSGKST